MATARSAEKEAFWRMAMEEHRHSGLTIKEFCKQQGISEPSFYAWRRELKKRDAQEQTPGEFVSVNLVDKQDDLAGKSSSVMLRIATPSGFAIDLKTDSTSGIAAIAVELERQWRATRDASC
ncbi:MAG: transposase [Planctomycetota bacterium]